MNDLYTVQSKKKKFTKYLRKVTGNTITLNQK